MHTAPPAKQIEEEKTKRKNNMIQLQVIAKFHHDVEDVLRHAVGVGVVDLLLGVVGGEPADLVPVLPPPPPVTGLLEDHDATALD